MIVQGDQQRVNQLVSAYAPGDPPQLPLTFGDYLSLLWRIDQSVDVPDRETYYRTCADSLAHGLGIERRSLARMVERTPAGNVYSSMTNLPYQGTARFVDAQDRRSAIWQMVDLRRHILEMGGYRDNWTLGWPGSRISDVELRERVFAVLFTAFEGQYSHFSRLLLVVDIVLEDLILGENTRQEISLSRLVREFGYPDPASEDVRMTFG